MIWAFLWGLVSGQAGVAAEVAWEAQRAGVPVGLALSVGLEESGLRRGLVSPKGAVGPMQVIPRWWCPQGRVEGCNLVRAGVGALRKLREDFGPWPEVLCRYNAGNVCWPRSRRYARRVLRRWDAAGGRG